MALLYHRHLHMYHYPPGPLSWLIYGLLFFLVNWFLYLIICTLDVISCYGFKLLIFINTWLGSKLISITNKVVLLGSTDYTLYGPNHFLVNFPNWDYSFGNNKTKSLNLNCFKKKFYWLQKALFHYWVPNLTSYCNLSFCSWSNSNTLLVKKFTKIS
jgi:hypothetical protein